MSNGREAARARGPARRATWAWVGAWACACACLSACGGSRGDDAGPAASATPAPATPTPCPSPYVEREPIPYREPAALLAPLDGEDTPRDATCGAAHHFLAAVRGWIVDRAGYPLPDAKAQLCIHVAPRDRLVCLRPATSDAEGVFTAGIPAEARCMSRVVMRALRPSGGMGTTYCEIDLTAATRDGAVTARLAAPFVLFPTAPAAGIPPLGDREASRTVRFADGLSIDLVPARYYVTGGRYAELSARRVAPDERGLCFLRDLPVVEGLYTFYPEGDVVDAPVPVRIPNGTGAPAGTRYELLVLGGLDCTMPDGSIVVEGTWRGAGTATVDAATGVIASDPGSGLPCLNWFAFRRLEDPP